jgi:3'(2'), 5'-bisphosphate nucleotidase
MNVSFNPEREAALRGALAAGALCERVQHEMVNQKTITKTDRSPVTVADYASQAVICRVLRESFGSDPIVAEETSHELRRSDNAGLLSRVTHFVRSLFPEASDERVCQWIDYGTRQIAPRYWCLDPIDGTKGFIRGDQYAVALALVIDGKVQLGALACPNLPADLGRPHGPKGVVFLAVRGEGAFQMMIGDDRMIPIKVSDSNNRSKVRFCESLESGHADHSTHGEISRRLGIVEPPIRMDSQAKYGILARGEASIYLRLPSPKTPDYREKVWDHAAGSILVEEAGGRVSDSSGEPLDFGAGYQLTNNVGVIASNGEVHKEILSAVQHKG